MTKQTDIELRLTAPATSVAIRAMTFADARAKILQTLAEMDSGAITPAHGMANLAAMKMLHDNINTEVNVHKLCLATEKKANAFGKAVSMGQALLLG